MKVWYLGLLIGGATGLLLVVLFLLWLQRSPSQWVPPQPPAPGADVTLFLSERALSRAASAALGRPAVIDAGPEGQLLVTTRVPFGSLEPAVRLGLALDRQESQVVSQLLWAQLAFIRIPVAWLPANVAAMGRLPGETLTRQLPPQFTLVGVTTGENGLTVQLNWLGP
jgi:hypothetical protein